MSNSVASYTSREKMLLYLKTLNSIKMGDLNKKIEDLISKIEAAEPDLIDTNGDGVKFSDPNYNLILTPEIENTMHEIQNSIQKEAL